MSRFKAWEIHRVITYLLIAATFCSFASGKTIYVDDDAAGANDGSSWADAHIYLQEALAEAASAEKPVEIRVAQGTYKPGEGLVATPEFDWRTATFQLINGVTLKGGYAGTTAPDPNVRDIELYETILSGDLNGDDAKVADIENLLAEPTRAENSYHVVTGSGTDETAMLDGFTVTGGNASRDEWQGSSSGAGMNNHSGRPMVSSCTFIANSAVRYGGGMYNYLHSNPKIADCVFIGNSAAYGGGVCNENSSPALSNCSFRMNSADWDGGGMRNSYNNATVTDCVFVENSAHNGGGMLNSVDSNPTLNDCTFSTNTAEESGAGIYNDYHSNAILTNCILRENSANENGGGMYNHENSDGMLIDCVFVRNSCGNGGGGMWNSMSSPTLQSCVFAENRADFGGGLVSMSEGSPILINCTFNGNRASSSGGMENSWDSEATLINCTFVGNRADLGTGGLFNLLSSATLANCILWDNSVPQIAGTAVVSYSDVQGGWPGEGNIDVDPLFADAGNGNYHLKSRAGRWDGVSGSWVIDDVSSPCIDAGDPGSPVAAEPYPNGLIVNMGAYGGTAEASKSPSGEHSRYGGGIGEPNDSYLIYTAEHMNTIGLHEEDWDKHFKLMADIDLAAYTGTSFNMIGRYIYLQENRPFSGTFDGNGHTISNFTYSVTDVNGIAIFAYVQGLGAAIMDLGLIDVNVDVQGQDTAPVDFNDPAIDSNDPNLYIGTGDRVASLVGKMESGTIIGCYVRGGRISGKDWVGGLVAYNEGLLFDCYSDVEVNGGTDVGGLAGVNAKDGVVISCRSLGDILGRKDVGGLVGNNDGAILDCHYSGHVVGEKLIGGLVGTSPGLISCCHSEGGIIGSTFKIGGLAGQSYGQVSDCYATGSVSGIQEVGGLVGNSRGSIVRSYSTSEVIGAEIGGRSIGGLVGDNSAVIISCFSAGSGYGDVVIGGLVGVNRNTIADSYSTASVSGYSGVGGLAGYQDSGTIRNCYATGSVTEDAGDQWVGGLVGGNEDSYVIASFWDVQTTGRATSHGGTGKTTAEMQSASTFLDAGWDFVDDSEDGTDDFWWIDEGRDYPRLSWETAEDN